MKRTILFIAFALTGLNANVFGQTFTYNGIKYEVTNTSPNEAKVGNNSGYSGAAVIPDSVRNSGVWYSVTAIGKNAFYNCIGLSGAVTIPNSVTTIGNSAFYGCSGLTSVTLGNSVTTISDYAFNECYGLSGALTIPNSVTTIGDWAFLDCSGLTSINVDANNPHYSSNDGILYNKVQDTLMQCPAGKTGAVTIPNSVTTIGERAFRYCGLTSLTLGNSVTTIGYAAFQSCSGLSGTLTIPNSVTTIGKMTFGGCSGLTSLTLGSSLTTIGERAFYNCSGLTALTLPNSVTIIGWGAFYNCIGLTAITIDTSVTTIGNSAFYGCSGLTEITSLTVNPPVLGGGEVFFNVPKYIPVHVPCGSEDAYKAANDWSAFTNYTDCIIENGLNDVDIVNINIYPNPASNRLFIEGEGFERVIVYDVLGKEVLASNKKEIDISGLASGVYNVRILQSGKTIAIRKMVKQ